MFEFLKNLFQKTTEPVFKFGAKLNPKDPRDVPVSAFQDKIPRVLNKYITDISMIPVLNQGRNGACVGHALATVVAYYDLLESGKVSNPSPRFIYGLAKKFDNLASEGTYPRVAGSVLLGFGCATEKTLPNDTNLSHSFYIDFTFTKTMSDDAEPRKIKGYAFANPNISELKNAIMNNGVVCLTLPADNSKWRKALVRMGGEYYHYITVYGFEGDTFFFRNSWGESWGDKGNGQFNFSEFKENIFDVMVVTDIPNKVLEEYKDKWKYPNFTPKEFNGLKTELMDIIQAMRTEAGFAFYPSSTIRSEGNHSTGLAIDLAVIGKKFFDTVKAIRESGFGPAQTFAIIKMIINDKKWDNDRQAVMVRLAIKFGVQRIGVYDRHLHIDLLKEGKVSPTIWWGLSE